MQRQEKKIYDRLVRLLEKKYHSEMELEDILNLCKELNSLLEDNTDIQRVIKSLYTCKNYFREIIQVIIDEYEYFYSFSKDNKFLEEILFFINYDYEETQSNIFQYNNANIDEESTYIFYRISRQKALTASEERDLFIRAKQGDEDARTELLNRTMKVVLNVALYHKKDDMPLAYLLSIGARALVRSYEKYDLEKNMRFGGYAFFRVNSLIKYFANKKSKSALDETYIIDEYQKIDNKEDISELNALDEILSTQKDNSSSYILDEESPLESESQCNISEVLRQILSDVCYETISMYCGFDGQKPMSIPKLAEYYHVSHQAIDSRFKYIKRKLIKSLNPYQFDDEILGSNTVIKKIKEQEQIYNHSFLFVYEKYQQICLKYSNEEIITTIKNKFDYEESLQIIDKIKNSPFLLPKDVTVCRVFLLKLESYLTKKASKNLKKEMKM